MQRADKSTPQICRRRRRRRRGSCNSRTRHYSMIIAHVRFTRRRIYVCACVYTTQQTPRQHALPPAYIYPAAVCITRGVVTKRVHFVTIAACLILLYVIPMTPTITVYGVYNILLFLLEGLSINMFFMHIYYELSNLLK